MECGVTDCGGHPADVQQKHGREITYLCAECERLQLENKTLRSRVSRLEERLDAAEEDSRRNNLLFYGIPTPDLSTTPPGQQQHECTQDTEQKVQVVVHRILGFDRQVHVDSVHRLGSAVLVRFQTRRDRDAVLAKAWRLKGSRFSLREDVSPAVRAQQRGLLPLYRELRSQGRRATLQQGTLLTDRGNFTYDVGAGRVLQLEEGRTGRGSFVSPDRRGSLVSPDRQGSLVSPSRQGSFVSPTRQGSLAPPTRRGSLVSPTRQGSLAPPSREIKPGSTWTSADVPAGSRAELSALVSDLLESLGPQPTARRWSSCSVATYLTGKENYVYPHHRGDDCDISGFHTQDIRGEWARRGSRGDGVVQEAELKLEQRPALEGEVSSDATMKLPLPSNRNADVDSTARDAMLVTSPRSDTVTSPLSNTVASPVSNTVASPVSNPDTTTEAFGETSLDSGLFTLTETLLSTSSGLGLSQSLHTLHQPDEFLVDHHGRRRLFSEADSVEGEGMIGCSSPREGITFKHRGSENPDRRTTKVDGDGPPRRSSNAVTQSCPGGYLPGGALASERESTQQLSPSRVSNETQRERNASRAEGQPDVIFPETVVIPGADYNQLISPETEVSPAETGHQRDASPRETEVSPTAGHQRDASPRETVVSPATGHHQYASPRETGVSPTAGHHQRHATEKGDEGALETDVLLGRSAVSDAHSPRLSSTCSHAACSRCDHCHQGQRSHNETGVGGADGCYDNALPGDFGDSGVFGGSDFRESRISDVNGQVNDFAAQGLANANGERVLESPRRNGESGEGVNLSAGLQRPTPRRRRSIYGGPVAALRAQAGVKEGHIPVSPRDSIGHESSEGKTLHETGKETVDNSRKREKAPVSATENRDHVAPRENEGPKNPRENGEHLAPRENGDHLTPRNNGDHLTPRNNGERLTPNENGEHVSIRNNRGSLSARENRNRVTYKETRNHVTPREKDSRCTQRLNNSMGPSDRENQPIGQISGLLCGQKAQSPREIHVINALVHDSYHERAEEDSYHERSTGDRSFDSPRSVDVATPGRASRGDARLRLRDVFGVIGSSLAGSNASRNQKKSRKLSRSVSLEADRNVGWHRSKGQWQYCHKQTMADAAQHPANQGLPLRLSDLDPPGPEGPTQSPEEVSTNGLGASSGDGDGTAREQEEDLISQKLTNQQDAMLLPIKEDLSEWITRIIGVDINPDSFIEILDSGVALCTIAKLIEKHAKEYEKEGKLTEPLPPYKLKCNTTAKSGTWFSRDNVTNFLGWCRAYGMSDETMFDSEDLVAHKQEKPIVNCVLELARLGWKYGIEPPNLIRMEREIEKEAKEFEPPPYVPTPVVIEKPVEKPVEIKKPEKLILDREVKRLATKCKCQEYVNRISEGVYDVFGKRVFIRLLHGKHLMVRVGGGWDTFENYLLHHDPIQVYEFRRDASNIKVKKKFDGYLVIKSKYKSS